MKGVIKDPARVMIWTEFPSILLYGGLCSKCEGCKVETYEMKRKNYCSNCFGTGEISVRIVEIQGIQGLSVRKR